MKPENYNKKQAKSVARVKSLIKTRLAWISGYPTHIENTWVWKYSSSAFYHDQEKKVDSQVISRSQRTVNTLLRDYPIALPSVVGDENLWHKRCITYIEFAKQLINSNKRVPPSLFDLDSTYASEYRRTLDKGNHKSVLVAMLSWKHYLDRSLLKSSLEFAHTKENNSVDDKNVINLAGLYALEKNRSNGLIEFSQSLYRINTLTYARHEYFLPYLKFKTEKAVKKHRKSFDPAPFPSIENLSTFEVFLNQISTFKPARRRHCLMFFETLNIEPIFHDWNQWWQQISISCRRITNHILLGKANYVGDIVDLQHEINVLFKQKPIDFSLHNLFWSIAVCSNNKTFCLTINSVIQSLNEHHQADPSIQEFMAYWAQIIQDLKPKTDRFKAYLLGLKKYLLTSGATSEKNSPWSRIPSYVWGEIDEDILTDATAKQISDFFTVISQIKSNGDWQLRRKDLEGLLNLSIGGFSPESIIEWYPNLIQHNALEDFSVFVAKISHRLKLSITEILTVLTVKDKLYESDENTNQLKTVYEIFESIEQLDFFKELILKHDKNQLVKYFCYIIAIKQLSGITAIPSPSYTHPTHSEWMDQYPTEFHHQLEVLNGLNRQVEYKVKSIFKAHWWPKAFITSEIQQLSESCRMTHVNQGAIHKRIEKLKHDLANHRLISDHKKQKITEKLTNLADRIYFFKWQTKVDQQFMQSWSTLFKLDPTSVPAWLTDNVLVGKLLPILSFAKTSRNLAIKVITARCQGTFMYLEHALQNQQFRELLMNEGIDLSVWPHGFDPYSYEIDDGGTITISIEGDPLEIIDMGGHFGTCLSPNDFNYFSVFTNIADINKQVIYARNEKGTVVARVLIGITHQGALQIFYRYAHHKKYNFAKQVMHFIHQIIEKTGLVLSGQGKVQPLCCYDWYDDGATYIQHDFLCLSEGSSFRQSIPLMSADEFIPQLTEAMKPNKLNALAFPAILDVPEIKNNPSLYPAILKLSATIKNIPVADLLKFYDYAHEMRQAASCYQTHRKRILRHLIHVMTSYYSEDTYAERIAVHHPSDALKVVKAVAKASKLNWKTDVSFTTKKTAYTALKKLGRDQLAEKFKP